MVSYNVVLGDSTTMEANTEGTNYVHFICKSVTIGLRNKNLKEDLGAHASFEIKMGEFVIDVTLNECVINELGDYTDTGKTTWNNFLNFICSSCDVGGDTLYLHIYSSLGLDAADGYFDWYKNASNKGKGYLQCKVSNLRFTIDATKQYAKGMLKLEEEWG